MKKEKLASVAIALMVLAAMAPATAVAQTDDEFNPVDDLLAVESNDSGFVSSAKQTASGILGGLNGLEKRLSYGVLARVGLADGWSAKEKANTVQERFNKHNESYESYVNNQTTASTSYDVFRISFIKGDQNTTVYLTADVANNSYTNATIVDSTNRTVDHYVELSGLAAKDAPNEIRMFRNAFVKNNRPVNYGYVAKLTAKYKGYVESDMLNNTSAS